MISPINNTSDVAREMKVVYRMAKDGQMHVRDATGLFTMLKTLNDIMAGADLEDRVTFLIEQLERRGIAYLPPTTTGDQH